MFFVFAIWGFLSFSFAYTTEFLILNVAAKAMAFVTVVTLFLPEKILALPQGIIDSKLPVDTVISDGNNRTPKRLIVVGLL